MSEYRVVQSGVSKVEGLTRTRNKYREQCPECGDLAPVEVDDWSERVGEVTGDCECCGCVFVVREGEKQKDARQPMRAKDLELGGFPDDGSAHYEGDAALDAAAH